ncbi:MAG: class D sortase [Oscillospiraceae bacterium]|nr:class D sortase [Oscillospiraceae bacterium]
MSKNNEKIKRKNNRWKIILYPIVFSFLTVMIYTAVLAFFAINYIEAGSLFFSKNGPDFGREPAKTYTEPKLSLGTVKYKDIEFPFDGDEFARLIVGPADIDTPVFYNDSPKELQKGVGTSRMAYIPGQGRTIVMGGHNYGVFSDLEKVKPGDRIEVKTHYGEYVYEAAESKIIHFEDPDTYDLEPEEENLILYTCHSETMVGATPYRLVVYCKFISGPSLIH